MASVNSNGRRSSSLRLTALPIWDIGAGAMALRWNILQPDRRTVAALTESVQCHPVISTLLVNRRIHTADQALKFLKPTIDDLRSPFSLLDMDRAVQRIAAALKQQEKILIFGDYDVDGVTSTVLLYEFLTRSGGRVDYYIPHRLAEGYSIQPEHIEKTILPGGYDLIVTADCGSASYEAVAALKEAGVDVVITDHHKISDPPPPATAVVNPQRRDCPSEMKHLAGVGVVFLLVMCLRKQLRQYGYWANGSEPNLKRLCDLVALGTVADMVPLTDENRILCRLGLDVINSGQRPGLFALMQTSGLKAMRADANDISFRIAPRLNAAGRIDTAQRATSLLLADSMKTAMPLAQSLDELNQTRQSLEKEIFQQLLEELHHYPGFPRCRTLVFANSHWHQGILGIVASRIAKRYCRPTVILSAGNGVGKGSARSIPGVDLFAALKACAEDLEAFGGHTMAAGITLRLDRLDAFRTNFERAVIEATRPENFDSVVTVDAVLRFGQISQQLLNELETLGPFGNANPEPLFMAREIRVIDSKIIGKNHRRLQLAQDGPDSGPTFSAMQFNVDTSRPIPERIERLAFSLNWNRWNGRKSPQLIVAAL